MKKGPTFDIKGKRGVGFNKPANDGKRINHSYFGCLLNTNYKPKSMEEIELYGEEYPAILQEVLNLNDDLFQRSITVVDDIKTLDDGRKTFTTHTMSPEEYAADIKHIRSRFKVEIGNDYGKGGRLHLHASFFVVHTSKIQMDLGPIVEAFNHELAGRGFPLVKYFHVKSEKPSTDLYMTKYDYVEN